jgi:hypothetical protein
MAIRTTTVSTGAQGAGDTQGRGSGHTRCAPTSPHHDALVAAAQQYLLQYVQVRLLQRQAAVQALAAACLPACLPDCMRFCVLAANTVRRHCCHMRGSTCNDCACALAHASTALPAKIRACLR